MQSTIRSEQAAKPARIELKTSPHIKSELEKAAALSGVTLTAFVIHQAAEAAKRITDEADSVRLNQQAWAKLNEVIDNPPKPTNALKNLMKL